MRLSRRNLRRIIKEETNKLLSEQTLPRDFTVDIHLGKYGKRCAEYVMDDLQDRLPRKADMYVDYGPKHLRGSGGFGFVAYSRSDLEYEVQLTVMLAAKNENIIQVRIQGPDRGTEKEEWTFGMNENPQDQLDNAASYIIRMLGYRT
jgi:hypothetical protein